MKTKNASAKHTSLFLLIMIITASLSAQYNPRQKPLLGAGGFYNFQTESSAAEVRFKIPLYRNVFITPRFSYYTPGNKIHEYYAGADMNWHLNSGRKIQPYLLAGAYYNNWINYEQQGASVLKKNNISPEAGCGIVFNIGCRLKPYLEYRYDIRWREGSIGAGLFLSFSKCPKSNRHQKCPAYQ
jgi:hypothetical protein